MSRVTEHYKRARNSLAGGVYRLHAIESRRWATRSTFRAPPAARFVWDLDGREYYRPVLQPRGTLLGHGDPRVTRAVEQAIARAPPAPTKADHAELAELLCDTIPACERVRFTGSGTEATMHCIRLARAFTGRVKMLKFEGNFHGYHDQVMFAIGTPADTLAPKTAPPLSRLDGHAARLARTRRRAVQPADLLEEAFAKHGDELAAVICEPVYYNAGCILPTRSCSRDAR